MNFIDQNLPKTLTNSSSFNTNKVQYFEHLKKINHNNMDELFNKNSNLTEIKNKKDELLKNAIELKNKLAGGDFKAASEENKIRESRDNINNIIKYIQKEINNANLDFNDAVTTLMKVNDGSAEDIKEFVSIVIQLAIHTNQLERGTKINYFCVTNKTNHVDLLLNGKKCNKYLTDLKAQSQKKFSTILEVRDINDNVVSGRIALSCGTHSIYLLHGKNKHQSSIINTEFPIYFFKDVQLGKMQKPSHCTVMAESDFEMIKKTIHSGAFGGDYCSIENNLVVVWKHPADLLYIDGYNPEPVPVEVGTYQFCDDTYDFNIPPVNGNATKLRIDIKENNSVVSIHQFVGKTIEGYEFNLPGISTGNFFNNFNDPEPEERKKLQTMIDDLKSLGIYAFMSNASHHAVIIYADDSNQQMTPQLLATRLQQDSSILTAISKAATGGKDMNQWKNAFINVFGSK